MGDESFNILIFLLSIFSLLYNYLQQHLIYIKRYFEGHLISYTTFRYYYNDNEKIYQKIKNYFNGNFQNEKFHSIKKKAKKKNFFFENSSILE